MEVNKGSQLSSLTPSSDKLTCALVGKLSETDDLRYHIAWTYGDYIRDIPKRIGRNNALDTAVAALVGLHSALRLKRESQISIPIEVLQKYAHAIKTLREYLDIPARARESETLCAVSLLLICSTYLGMNGSRTYHGEGAAQILRVRGYYDPQDDFEEKLLLCFRGPVLFEALINPRIQFSPQEWKTIVENKLDGTDRPEGMMLRCLARAPEYMRRGKIALRERTGLPILVSDMRQQYRVLLNLLDGLRDRYLAFQQPDPAGTAARNSMSKATIEMANHHYQRMYGFGLTICMIFNSILKILDRDCIDLNVDAQSFCKETLKHADEAAKYRPIGAGYVMLCLAAAWACCGDYTTQLALERLVVEYSSDFGWSPPETNDYLHQSWISLKRLEPQ